jgi:nitroimidazol reductase NimA-like FMN-containing flavoprotein (pyridoxamine 5'-phosphate oxidase superfamily)
MTSPQPQFRELDERECRELLARNHVGRIAYARQSRVDIEPISYVFGDGWLFGRTAPGTKVDMLGHQPWVAFQVDEVKGPFDWRSVVVHGTYYALHAEGSEVEKETYRRALAAIRGIMPAALTADDPAPHRVILFGIHMDVLTGRAASTSNATPA